MSMTVVEPQERSPEPATRLGEELPVFCERCGYSLHGSRQFRCEQCAILQFHCPECGHHQPINTLRPAVQTILGRIRGAWLLFVVLFKLNLFGWTLFMWVVMGAAFSEELNYRNWRGPYDFVFFRAVIPWDWFASFTLIGLAWGMVSRMALLRWRRGWIVGCILAGLAVAMVRIGVWLEMWNRTYSYFSVQHRILCGMAAICIVLGATAVWPLWQLLVNLFLPKRTAAALLNWQSSLSNEVSALAREPIRSDQNIGNNPDR
jgi:hypothetical protein